MAGITTQRAAGAMLLRGVHQTVGVLHEMAVTTDRGSGGLREATETATILIVEDDEPIRFALRELLEAEGYEVVVAADGREALAALSRITPALVVTDLNMPHVDGVALCRRLRADPATRKVPIVVLTAAHRIDGITGRVDAIIRKPFDIDDLLATVAQFIRPTVPPRNSTMSTSGRFVSLTPYKSSLTLFVTARSAASERALSAVRVVLSSGEPPLEVIDVTTDPERARRDGVGMTPTLMRVQGGHRDVFLGDLSDPELIREFLSRPVTR